jgi:hypothetical protein
MNLCFEKSVFIVFNPILVRTQNVMLLSKTFSNPLSAALAMIFIALIYQSCTENCDCPLPIPTTSGAGSKVKNEQLNRSLEGEVNAGITQIKKLIQGDAVLSGKLQKGKAEIETMYWEIQQRDSAITQRAFYFWCTACAMYEIVCEDNTISEPERVSQKKQIIKEYEEKINTLFTTQINEPTPPPPNPAEPTPGQTTLPATSTSKNTAYDSIQISGKIAVKEGISLTEVKVRCMSCMDKDAKKVDSDGLFSFTGKIKKGKARQQQIQLCYEYRKTSDCIFEHYNYLDQISVTPNFQ